MILQSLLIHICKAAFWEARSPCVLCCGDAEKKPVYCVCVNNLVTWGLGQFQLMFTSTAALHSRQTQGCGGVGEVFFVIKNCKITRVVPVYTSVNIFGN